MARGKKSPSGMTQRKRGLDALREVRDAVPAVTPAGRLARKLNAPTPPEPTPGADTADDAALFERAMRDVAPLPDAGQAELESPKPQPVPRRKSAAELEDDATPPTARPNTAPRSDADLFRSWMDDVTPIAADRRAELHAPRPAPEPFTRAGPAPGDDKPHASAPLPPGSETLGDSELFRHLMRSAQPLDSSSRADIPVPPPPPTPIKRREDDEAVLRDSLEAPLTLEDRLDMGEEAAFLRPGLPRRVLTDLRRGRWVLQGELDLHGFKRDEARTELARFLAQALRQGHRCVRVIHGKGLGSPGRFSILKQLSRGWLAQREEILAFCQAGPNQGGSGALMVLLRGQQAPRQN